jgi:hypothetical protein
MLPALKRKVADGFLVVADIGGLLLSASGATVVAVLGKLMLAVVLGAVALGFFLRLVGRRQRSSVAPIKAPLWCHLAAVLLAVVEVALLAEATNLPIRFYQPGFQLQHWLLVVFSLVVAYALHTQIFCSILRGQRVASQP